MKPLRLVAATFLIFVGVVGELAFGGGQVATCLGPIGITPIQCARVTRMVPATPIAAPLFALTIAAGLLLLAPVPAGRRASALLAGAIGACAGAIAFLARAPRTWTGLGSSGSLESIDLPFDAAALATVVVIVATLGILGWAYVVGPGLARLRPARP
jgi:hypothetical protein